MTLQVCHQQNRWSTCDAKMLKLRQKINTAGTLHVFSLFVRTLRFSATLVLTLIQCECTIAQQTPLRIHTIFKVNTADFNNLHVWFFFSLLLNINMFVLHLSFRCPTHKFSSLVGTLQHREVFGNQWQVIFQVSSATSARSWQVVKQGTVSICFPSCPGAVWSSESDSPISFIRTLFNYAAILDEF